MTEYLKRLADLHEANKRVLYLREMLEKCDLYQHGDSDRQWILRDLRRAEADLEVLASK